MIKKYMPPLALAAVLTLSLLALKSEPTEVDAGPVAGSACCTALCAAECGFPPLAAICTVGCVATVGACFPSLGMCTPFFLAPTP